MKFLPRMMAWNRISFVMCSEESNITSKCEVKKSENSCCRGTNSAMISRYTKSKSAWCWPRILTSQIVSVSGFRHFNKIYVSYRKAQVASTFITFFPYGRILPEILLKFVCKIIFLYFIPNSRTVRNIGQNQSHNSTSFISISDSSASLLNSMNKSLLTILVDFYRYGSFVEFASQPDIPSSLILSLQSEKAEPTQNPCPLAHKLAVTLYKYRWHPSPASRNIHSLFYEFIIHVLTKKTVV
jgi:hypothetical protein